MSSLTAAAYLPKYPVTQWAKPRRVSSGIPPVISALKTSTTPRKCPFPGLCLFDYGTGLTYCFDVEWEVSEFSGDDVLRDFLREREVSGDFIAKLSDELWLKKGSTVNSENVLELGGIDDVMEEPGGEENENGGFLKLKQNSEWLLGDSNSVPLNKKTVYKEVLDVSERRKRLNFLRYEALKRELLLLTVGIGTACTGYCLVALSVQAGISYAVGVVFSCLYFQLLCKHADNISSDIVPQIFTKKRTKRIGIRSEDLQDAFERSVKGASIALSSPRLVMPAAIYGLWELSQHFFHDVFDFQLVPAMVGLFAYKAAALVQVYRDNEDLQFIFPDSAEDLTD
ncbi:hypothetical protein F511_05697 [Dorcoceras hygrometricum]|uniref:Uncharacterized protein n=1 Tax=Dorcoceras hygrometricum TaxID=472368 RepID=A0A2Z7BF20_9LAMI|nr:hypothetical protein F511_05697 [Dorcoceras hygrometricum]